MTETVRGRDAEALRAQQGFTLVELAIVLVIIGLIIGGVLKGQELIQSAKLRSTIQAGSAIQSASASFRDKYQALPGDFANAQAQIGVPAGVTWAAGNGDGDGLIEGDGTTLETLYFWQHLAASGFITGVEIAATPTSGAGRGMPAAPVGGGFTVDRIAVGGLTTNWLVLGTVAAGQAGILTGEQSRTVDSKVDDGLPATGSVRTNTAACINAGQYQLTSAANACLLVNQL